jgi:hypothetical protein
MFYPPPALRRLNAAPWISGFCALFSLYALAVLVRRFYIW